MFEERIKGFWQYSRVILLTIALSLAVYVAVALYTNTQDEMWSYMLSEVSIALLSTIVALYIFWDIDKNSRVTIDQLQGAVNDAVYNKEQSPFIRVDLNRKMGEEYWLDLIAELDSTPEDVWFVGTKLSTWLTVPPYKSALEKKLKGRFNRIVAEDGKTGSGERFATFILLTDSTWAAEWTQFLCRILDSEFGNADGATKKERLKELCLSRVTVATLPENTIRYSLVLCGERLTVIPYLNAGRSVESPTLDIKPRTHIYALYQEDIVDLLRRVTSSDKQM